MEMSAQIGWLGGESMDLADRQDEDIDRNFCYTDHMPNTRVPKDHERDALTIVIDALAALEHDARLRIVQTVSTFYGLQGQDSSMVVARPVDNQRSSRQSFDFTNERELSPKEFLADKQPETDIERVACLAFYLAHYRDTPQFKTIDISRLNTEAAQIKFSNTAYAVNNASKKGFLAPAGKGAKQITSMGEHFVTALPDRDAAAGAMSRQRKRSSKRSRKKA